MAVGNVAGSPPNIHFKDSYGFLLAVELGLAVDVQGRPIGRELTMAGQHGRRYHFEAGVERLRRRFRLREIAVVADRAVVSQEALEAFESAQSRGLQLRLKKASGRQERGTRSGRMPLRVKAER
jgi:hypothetical protein